MPVLYENLLSSLMRRSGTLMVLMDFSTIGATSTLQHVRLSEDKQAEAQSCIAFFNKEHIELLDWPSKSSDVNPTENMWSIIRWKVYANEGQIDSVQALIVSLMDEWETIPKEFSRH
uniref:AlNc14C11G1376 protein n=1 Tax=Albugo laibachii Nc14 TaxID=890382 RepID=F0W2Z7_9STRA|nr:AlNc14C11G1376 [Albugo laibachii Nc14]|eukprot:CCA15434.1 AlNc14C11G1376 [Albugo laibachii Nc14]